MAGLLFVTAQNVDFKHINRLLLHLRDWQYGQEGTWDSFRLVTTKNAYDIDKPENGRGLIDGTTPPIPSEIYNGWSGARLSDIEGFMLDIAKPWDSTENQGFNSSIYIILDEKGLQDRTCVFAERRFDDEANELTDHFNKVRVPWSEVYIVFVNVNIGNVGFEDYCDERSRDDDGWHTYGQLLKDTSEENARKRDETIARLEREGKA
ncbi:hypothetical protein LTR36_004765 [Oleoguttula mirabilis]|uniref:Uncharacterized protein n=1 Tax=Oleoguttula mirabilis TaxID=1507867 RepID=A0AAV9JFU8_9PEZI|nr:hypothetical protein LTR36_004765 [Oleoguttula mirabilis]